MSCVEIGFADRIDIVLIRNIDEMCIQRSSSAIVHEKILLVVFRPDELLASLSNFTKNHDTSVGARIILSYSLV